MKFVYVALYILSSSAWARGYQTGTYNCINDGKVASSWLLTTIDTLPGLPMVQYSVQTGTPRDVILRSVGTVQEVVNGTIIGIRGLRESDGKYVLFFNSDGSVKAGEIPCTKI